MTAAETGSGWLPRRYPDGHERRIRYPQIPDTDIEVVSASPDPYQSFAEEAQPDRWGPEVKICSYGLCLHGVHLCEYLTSICRASIIQLSFCTSDDTAGLGRPWALEWSLRSAERQCRSFAGSQRSCCAPSAGTLFLAIMHTTVKAVASSPLPAHARMTKGSRRPLQGTADPNELLQQLTSPSYKEAQQRYWEQIGSSFKVSAYAQSSSLASPHASFASRRARRLQPFRRHAARPLKT